ncbi:MAG: sulfatase [Pirellula sp.]
MRDSSRTCRTTFRRLASILLALVYLTVSFVTQSEFAHAIESKVRQPSVVFIMADDLGWRDLGCYGSTFHQTPNLDKLASRGARFTQAYAANPLCSPTRSSILTGLWPARTGITAPACHLPKVVLDKHLVAGNPNQRVLVAESITRLKTDYMTLPKILRNAGYRTGHFGKWHLGPEPYSALQHGFDVDWPHWPGPGPAGSYVSPWRFPENLRVGNQDGNLGEHIEDLLSGEVVKFIRENKDRPFYANYWQFSVHAPYDAKDELVAKYRERIDANNPQRNPVYAAMVESLDDGIGRVMAAIDECGIADHTIIVFCSDNGGVSWPGKAGDEHKSIRFQADMKSPPTSNLPLRNGKASLYEGGVREPCLVVWPGVSRSGSVNDAIIQSIDWMPTILDMVGVPMPASVKPDGISITPALKGSALAREAIYTHFPHDTPASGQHPGTSVRRGDWKLIRLFAGNQDGSDKLELFNLKEDLGETNDLAETNPAIAIELNQLIDRFLRETEAVIPKLNPRFKKSADAK